MREQDAIDIFRRRGVIPPGHGDTIAAYLNSRHSREET